MVSIAKKVFESMVLTEMATVVRPPMKPAGATKLRGTPRIPIVKEVFLEMLSVACGFPTSDSTIGIAREADEALALSFSPGGQVHSPCTWPAAFGRSDPQ